MSFNQYEPYVEHKPHYLKMVVWRLFNITVFPLLPMRIRDMSLRAFGAKIGKNGIVYRSARIYAPWNLSVGDCTVIGPRSELYNKGYISIGSSVVISQDAYLCTASHDISSRSLALKVRPIDVGTAVWIAAKAVVMPGVTIGEGAVVACAAVVAKSVAPWTVVGGNPAKFIKNRIMENA